MKSRSKLTRIIWDIIIRKDNILIYYRIQINESKFLDQIVIISIPKTILETNLLVHFQKVNDQLSYWEKASFKCNCHTVWLTILSLYLPAFNKLILIVFTYLLTLLKNAIIPLLEGVGYVFDKKKLVFA